MFLQPISLRVVAWLWLCSLINVALSQTGSQNASIPDCIRSCDTTAIAAANCTSTDQYCHCVKYTAIYDSIVPCVQYRSNCTNGTADLLIFESLFNEVCTQFNLSVPTNVTTTNTSISTLSPTASLYTSEATTEGWHTGMLFSVCAFVTTAFCFGVFL